MMRRLLTLVLVSTLPTAHATAGDLKEAVEQAAARATRQERPAARGENPYYTPGLALIGAGAGLFVLGVLTPGSVSCTEDRLGFECGVGSHKGLTWSGALMAGAGGFLLWKGEQQRSGRRPQISLQRDRISINNSIRW